MDCCVIVLGCDWWAESARATANPPRRTGPALKCSVLASNSLLLPCCMGWLWKLAWWARGYMVIWTSSELWVGHVDGSSVRGCFCGSCTMGQKIASLHQVGQAVSGALVAIKLQAFLLDAQSTSSLGEILAQQSTGAALWKQLIYCEPP